MKTTFAPLRLRDLNYWVAEREAIRVRRENGQLRPWTSNPVLMGTRFCNVRRMDDKVSQWLLDNWYWSAHALTRPQVLAQAGLARLINWPDALDGLRGKKTGRAPDWDPERVRTHLKTVKEAGKKVFTGVYIINGAGGGSKIDIVVKQVIALHANASKLLVESSMEETHTRLQTMPGVGSFIAGQIVADLRHVWHPARERDAAPLWADRDTWAPLGPGSRRGMGWLQGWNGVDDLPRMRQEDFEVLINELMATMLCYKEFAAVAHDRELEMHDLQNCLCEFDKFCRLTNGTGQAKNKFNGYPETGKLL